MNNIISEVKIEKVIEQGINTNELPKDVEKRVLHIKLISKTAEQMKIEYSFNASTLGQIGCLVTSISILIEKSGCNTTITPFNPGTFLEALNANNAFDINGNLQYAGVTKAVLNFKYGGNVNLRGKSRTEKLALITQYYNQGYYLTIEVKGATPGNQHWGAITGVNGNNVNIVDPGSNGTDLWSSYEWSKSSQFNYFMVN